MLNIVLKEIRLYHKLRQAELAKKINVSRGHLSEIEKGKKGVSIKMLTKYSKVFNIPVSHIFTICELIENKNTQVPFKEGKAHEIYIEYKRYLEITKDY